MCCLTNWPLMQSKSLQRLCPVPRARPWSRACPIAVACSPFPALRTMGPTDSVNATELAACQLLTFLQRLSSRCFREKCDMLSLIS